MSIEQAAAIAMMDLERRVRKEASARRLTTSAVVDGITTRVVGGGGGVVAEMEAGAHWRWVGNGRGPGRMPPVTRIAEWVDRAGLSASPWAIARSIADHGSRAWRRRESNIFAAAIESWERDGAIDELSSLAAVEVERAAVMSIKRAAAA